MSFAKQTPNKFQKILKISNTNLRLFVGPSHLFPIFLFIVGTVYLHCNMRVWYSNTRFSPKFQKKIKKIFSFQKYKNIFYLVWILLSLSKNNKKSYFEKIKIYDEFEYFFIYKNIFVCILDLITSLLNSWELGQYFNNPLKNYNLWKQMVNILV